MNREFSGWGVILSGGLLAIVGGYWLYAGWDHIQIERGWSQFIAGAMALSGGIVTIAIGRLIRLLVMQPGAFAQAEASSPGASSSPAARSAALASDPLRRPLPPEQSRPANPQAGRELLNFDPLPPQENANVQQVSAQAPGWSHTSMTSESEDAFDSEEAYWRSQDSPYQSVEEPREVDRYVAGDSTYVMFSDGSVEVRSPAGVRLYDSLEALRANRPER